MVATHLNSSASGNLAFNVQSVRLHSIFPEMGGKQHAHICVFQSTYTYETWRNPGILNFPFFQNLQDMSYLSIGVSPSIVIPASHNGKLIVIERRVRITELSLRCLICVLAVVSAVLVGTDSQVKQIFTFQKRATFTDMKSLVLLVVVDGIAATYSLLHICRCVNAMIRGSLMLNKSLAWTIFSCDQMMAYLTVATVAAAVQTAAVGELGQPEMAWSELCDMYGKFCYRMGEGIAGALVASVTMVIVSSISAFSLFRLYGNKTENRNEREKGTRFVNKEPDFSWTCS